MNEIEDSSGTVIPLSQVKSVVGVGSFRVTGLYDDDRDGPCHLTFQTIDGKLHSSKDYADRDTAEAEMVRLRMRVEELSTARGGAPRQT